MIDLANRYLNRHSSVRQFLKFSLVGIFNTFFDFGIYTFLTRLFGFFGQHYLIANFISFSCAVTSSFFLNKHWTFQNKEKKKAHLQYLKFWLAASVGLGLNELILFILVHYAGVYDLLAKAAATAVVLFWNFFATKYWAFKE